MFIVPLKIAVEEEIERKKKKHRRGEKGRVQKKIVGDKEVAETEEKTMKEAEDGLKKENVNPFSNVMKSLQAFNAFSKKSFFRNAQRICILINKFESFEQFCSTCTLSDYFPSSSIIFPSNFSSFFQNRAEYRWRSREIRDRYDHPYCRRKRPSCLHFSHESRKAISCN
jgi:hypothetical protein